MTEQITISTELTRLRKEYTVLRDRKPLAIGIRAILLPQINLNSKNSRKVIRLLCNHRGYLTNVTKGGARYNLEGSVDGEITTEEIQHAKEKLLEGKINTLSEEKSSNTLKLSKKVS